MEVIFCVMVASPFLTFLIMICFLIKHTKTQRQNAKIYEKALSNKSGFNPTKRIVTNDFVGNSLRTHSDLFIGIWIDYDTKQMAIRTSWKDIEPKVYSLDNIIDYEVLEDISEESRARQGLFGEVNVIYKRFAINVTLRIKFGGSVGASVVELPLLYMPFRAKFLAVAAKMVATANDVEKADYKGISACVRAIIDELKVIQTKSP